MTALIVGISLLCVCLGAELYRTHGNKRLLSDRVQMLSNENVKLSNLVLEYQNENLLCLEEHKEASNEIERSRIDAMMEMSAKEIPSNICYIPARSKVDELIDKIENEMEVTSCYSKRHSNEEFNNKFEGENPIVTIELNGGVVKLIDCASSSNWSVDMLYNNVLFTNLSADQCTRLKGIFSEKMAQAAIRDTKTKPNINREEELRATLESCAYGPDYPGCDQIEPGVYVSRNVKSINIKTNE